MKRKILFIVIPFILAFFLCFIVSEKACNYALTNHPAKPVPFNHKAHVTDFGAECETCHSYYDNGRFKGIPEAGVCLECHESSNKTGESSAVAGKIEALEKYKDTDKPWGAYAEQPDLVYFSHKIVMSAPSNKKVECATCHGLKAESADTKMLKGKMLMNVCEDCHTRLNISNKCMVCHK